MPEKKYIKVFLFFIFIFALFTKGETLSWNDASRMAQIQAIVESKTLIIDNTIFIDSTNDKYFYNGHFYSDKSYLLAFFVSPIYYILYHLGISFAENISLAMYMITLLSIGVLSAFSLVILHKMLIQFSRVSEEWADTITLVIGTGTLILPYSIVFNNHIVSGTLLLFGFYNILRFGADNKTRNAIFAGFFFSLAGGIDFACFVYLIFGAFYFAIKRFRVGILYLLSCVPLLSIYLLINLYTSGSIIPPDLNASLWEYTGSAFNESNLSGLTSHDNFLRLIKYAFHSIIGNRGLLLHSPVILFSVIGVLYGEINKEIKYKLEYLLIFSAILIFICAYLFLSTNYSGSAYGIRWFVSLFLILGLPIAFLENPIRLSNTFKNIFIAYVCVSILFSLIGTVRPFAITGSDIEEYLHPTNTLFINAIRIYFVSTAYKLKFIFSAILIYFVFLKTIKSIKLIDIPE